MSVSFTKEDIIEKLIERLENGKWYLIVLSQAEKELGKDELLQLVNQRYRDKHGKDLILSRPTHTVHTARLEAAGLVDIERHGRYSYIKLSALGREILEYQKKKKAGLIKGGPQ